MQEPLLMDLRNNVYLEDDSLVIIDRRKLPTEQVPVVCRNYEEVARAIEDMVVQGAGDIAITAGYGLYLATKALERQGKTVKWEELEPVINRLKSTRPTGFHLAALLDRLKRDLAETNEEKEIPLSNRIQQYLETILDKQKVRSEKTGTPTAGSSVLSSVAGMTRPPLANTVYERAIWNRLADRP